MNDSKIFQLDMFMTQEESEMDCMRKEISAIRDSTGKVRRSLFARQGDLTKIVMDLQDRLAIIERNICRGV